MFLNFINHSLLNNSVIIYYKFRTTWTDSMLVYLRLKLKKSVHSPGEALKVPGGWGRQAHECGKIVSPKYTGRIYINTLM